jgi:hypothetical protein
MNNKRTITILTLAMAIAAIASFGIFRDLQDVVAFNPQPDPPGYGMVGITAGQTIRISVVNTNEPDSSLPPDPCRVVMTFRDVDGNLFRNSEGQLIRRIVQLPAGQSAFLDLNGDVHANGGRMQLRPVARIQQAEGTSGLPPDPCIPTVEVFANANGKTQFVVPTVTTARLPPPVGD